jgi:hypothetical protein
MYNARETFNIWALNYNEIMDFEKPFKETRFRFYKMVGIIVSNSHFQLAV